MLLRGSFIDKGIVTPDTIADLTPGNYTIKLTKSGYNDAEMTVTVTPGQTTYVGMTLIITKIVEAEFHGGLYLLSQQELYME